MNKFRSGIPSLLLIVLVLMSNILARSIFSPLLLHVEEDFGVSHGPVSRLFIYIGAGYSLSLLCSGFLSSKITHRVVILLSTLVMALSLVFTAVAPSLNLMRVTVFLMGVGAGLYPASGVPTITAMMDQKDWQRAFSIHEIGPHLAMLIAPLFANLMLQFTGWRGTVGVLSILVMATGLIFFVKIKAGSFRGEKPSFARLVPLFREFNFWILIVFFGLALGGVQGIYLLVPTFLVTEGGFSLVTANNIFGISRFLPILSLLTAGLFLDRFGWKLTIRATIFGTGLTALLMGILKGPLLIVAIFLQPAVGALFFPAGLVALSMVGPPRSRNVAVSMVLPPAMLMGTGLIPAFLGYMGDEASFSLGFVLVGILIMVSSLLAKALTIPDVRQG